MRKCILLLLVAHGALAQMYEVGVPQAIPNLDRAGAGAPTMPCTVSQRYFQTDATPGENQWYCTALNVWTRGAKPTQTYGEMYFYTAAAGPPTSLAIHITGQYHGINLTATGTTSNGWTYKAGVAGVVSSVADNGGVVPGTILVTTSAPHNLAVGDYVCHVGFTTRTTYQGKYKVLTTPLATTYTVTRAFQTSTDTGWFQRAWSLRANTGSAGLYRISFTLSAEAISSTTSFRFEVNKNNTDLDSIAGQVMFQTASRPQQFVGIGLVPVADDDVIYMSVKNLTDASDFSAWLSTLSVNRL